MNQSFCRPEVSFAVYRLNDMTDMKCPHCGNDDQSMIESLVNYRRENGIVIKIKGFFCNVCGKKWVEK